MGSNNVNLLHPAGQFGTRAAGGKDHASARYISTYPVKLARKLLHPSDDPLLAYLKDDNLSIEPEWYVPTVPLILLNGAEGIGTGEFRLRLYSKQRLIDWFQVGVPVFQTTTL